MLEDLFETEKKIIATTTYLKSTKWHSTCFSGEEIYEPLPQPSQEFIDVFVREYNKGNIITEVMVEYESYCNCKIENNVKQCNLSCCNYLPKINPKDNTITIRKIKDSWTKEEVTEYGKLAFEIGRNFQLTGENNIKEIENNL